MPKIKTATIADVEEVIKSIDRLYSKNFKDLTEIKQYLIEIKTEIRMIRMLYSFWAERNLSPEFMEKFAKEFETIEPSKPKRVD